MVAGYFIGSLSLVCSGVFSTKPDKPSVREVQGSSGYDCPLFGQLGAEYLLFYPYSRDVNTQILITSFSTFHIAQVGRIRVNIEQFTSISWINYTFITITAGALHKAVYSTEFKFVLDAFLKLPIPSVFIFFRR